MLCGLMHRESPRVPLKVIVNHMVLRSAAARGYSVRVRDCKGCMQAEKGTQAETCAHGWARMLVKKYLGRSVARKQRFCLCNGAVESALRF